MKNSEIDRQLGEIWKKASGKEYIPELPFLSSRAGSDIETIQFLKNNFSRAESDWKHLLEVKESNIRDISTQLDETRAHLDELKQYYQEAREKAAGEELSLALNLEESGKMLDIQKKRHACEVALLKEVQERTRIETAAHIRRLKALSAERDEWREKFSESAVDRSNLADAAAGLEHKLSAAKEAVGETLSELCAEREKIREFQKKAGDLEAQLSKADINLAVEREEWRELRDRERAAWETHRQEFAVLETRLRSELEALSAKLKEEERKSLECAAGPAGTPKEFAQRPEKAGVQLPSVVVPPADAAAADRSRVGAAKIFSIALAGLILLGGFAGWVYDYRTKVHFSLLSRRSLDLPNATWLSLSADGLWLADWDKGLILKDPGNLATLRIFNGGGGPFRPAAVAAFDGGVWALDIAQLRFIRKNLEDGGILESVKSPGPSPQGVAWDGDNLWSFDAATALLYRYGLSPSAGVDATFELPALRGMAAMQWAGGALWTLDTRNTLTRYILKNGVFTAVSSQELKVPAIAFWAGKDYFWTLEKSGAAAGLEIGEYKLKTY